MTDLTSNGDASSDGRTNPHQDYLVQDRRLESHTSGTAGRETLLIHLIKPALEHDSLGTPMGVIHLCRGRKFAHGLMLARICRQGIECNPQSQAQRTLRAENAFVEDVVIAA